MDVSRGQTWKGVLCTGMTKRGSVVAGIAIIMVVLCAGIFGYVVLRMTGDVEMADHTTGEVLDLHDQNLTQLPGALFSQTQLSVLDLSHNHLTGALPAEIRFLNRLVVLDLSDNAMTGVPAEIGQLTQLKILDLSNNELTGLPHELGQLTNLETLDLRGNSCAPYDLDVIRKSLTGTQILTD